MKRAQAEKLLGLADGETHFVVYNPSPYIAGIESGEVFYESDSILFSNDSISDVNVEEADVEDFDVYRKVSNWTRLK